MLEQVLPFYVVCDVSYSMTDHMDTLNDGLGELHRAIGADPLVAERTRFCLIGFSSSAEVLVPLAKLGELAELASLTTRSETSFGAAFRLLRDTIDRDVTLLKANSHRVLRPAVFFISDGHPTDPAVWPRAYDRLVDPSWSARPNIISFGVGDADTRTISRVGTVRAYLSRNRTSPATALAEFTRTLTRSMVLSGSAPEGEVVLRLPEEVSGYTAVCLDQAG